MSANRVGKRFGVSVSVWVLFQFSVFGCAGHSVARAPTAAAESVSARVLGASIAERFRLGVDDRMKAGLGFGYFAAIREKGQSSAVGAGDRTLEPVARMGEHDLLEIGSVTKTFTGILIHLAVLEGKLRLDTKLEELLPTLRGSEAGGITILDLGIHRSGLPREPIGITIPDPRNPRHGLDRNEVILALSKVKLSGIPEGETQHRRNDSNWGFMTLGIVLENLSGKAYPELVDKRVLFPLGMRESGVDRKTRKHGKWMPKASPGFALDGGSLPLRDYDGFSAATGGVESNAADMVKFLAALENPPHGRLGQAITDGMNSGIGWDSAPGANPVWKNGATTAHASILVFDRVDKKGIFIGSNTMVSPDDLGFLAEGARTRDDLLALTLPKRIVSAEEIARLKGSFIPAAPIPVGYPPLRRVDLSETFGRLVARFVYDVFSTGGLLIPEEKEFVWRFLDGMDNRDEIVLSSEGLTASTLMYRAPSIPAELKKVINDPEKYPAIEK